MSNSMRINGDQGISRRDLLKGLGVGVVGAGLGLGLDFQPVAAQTSAATERVIAFYRFHVGEHEVTVINDGFIDFPPSFLVVNAPEDDVRTEQIAKEFRHHVIQSANYAASQLSLF